MISAAVTLTGCFFPEKINRQPQILDPMRMCDGADPAVGCTLDVLRPSEVVRVKATFYDVDGDPDNGTIQWRIAFCGSSLSECDPRLPDQQVQIAEFTVKSTLETTGGPVQCVVADLHVFDERGASSATEFRWLVTREGEAPPERCFTQSRAATGSGGTAP